MKSSMIALGAAMLSAWAAPATAQGQAGRDVRCLMASNLFVKSANTDQARQTANVSAVFFLGRASGQLSSAQLRAELLAQEKLLTPANATETMRACVQTMQNATRQIQAVGAELSQQRKP